MKILAYPDHIEKSGIESPIPSNYQNSTLAWTSESLRKYDFGSIATHSFDYKHYRIHLYRIILMHPSKLLLCCNDPVIALQFIIKGGGIIELPGMSRFKLDANRWGMLYLPLGRHLLNLQSGETITIYIELSKHHLLELTESRVEIARLQHLLQQAATIGDVLPHAYTDNKTNDELAGILNANDPLKELPIELNAHITALLNHYRKFLNEADEFHLLPDVTHKGILIDLTNRIKAAPNLKYSIIELAKEHGIYYKSLARSFKELTGYTLKLYVHEQLMHQALTLLIKSDIPLSEIASKLGYAEPNNLYRAFSKYYGKTMLTVRKNPGSLSQVHRLSL